MSVPCRVLIVDDHLVARLGVAVMLERVGGFSVCGEADNVAVARELTGKLHPDLIVLDLMLGGRDGIELIAELCEQHAPARILVYSGQDERRYARRALRAGAQGYVMKSAGLDEVRRALEALRQGELWVSAAMQRDLVAEAAGIKRAEAIIDELSDRELHIFRLLGEGRSSAEIARDLHLSMKTVGTYRERIKDKLGVATARELERSAEAFVREPGSIDATRPQNS